MHSSHYDLGRHLRRVQMKKPSYIVLSVFAVLSLCTLAYAAKQTCSASTSSEATDRCTGTML